MSEATFVTVARFTNTFEAELARNDLQSAGLHAFLLGQPIAAVDWMRISTIGGIRLQVPSDEAERADAILEEARSAERARKRRAETGTSHGDESTQREENAYRALRAAGLGLLFLLMVPYAAVPLHAYAAWLLIKVKRSEERLSPQARKCAVVAAALVGIAVVALLILSVVPLVIHLWWEQRF